MILFASDFDGTLHFLDPEWNGYFKQKDLKAIQQFRKDGNVFGLCTGRPLYGMEDDLIGGPEMDYIIASTGGVITDIKDGEYHVLWERTIPVTVLRGIYDQAEKLGYEMYVHADGYVYTFEYRRHQYPSQTVLNQVEDIGERHVTGASIWTPDEENASSFVKHLNETEEAVIVYQNKNWMDVVEKSVSKGNGAFTAKDLFHCDMVAGIGDSYNDIPLLKAADISFTFHSSPEVVKDEADYIVDSIAEAISILEKTRK